MAGGGVEAGGANAGLDDAGDLEGVALGVNVVVHHVEGFGGASGDDFAGVVNRVQGIDGGFDFDGDHGGVFGAAGVFDFVGDGGEVAGGADRLIGDGAIRVQHGGAAVWAVDNTSNHKAVALGVGVVTADVDVDAAAGFGHGDGVIGSNHAVKGGVGHDFDEDFGGAGAAFIIGNGVAVAAGAGEAVGGRKGDGAVAVQYHGAVLWALDADDTNGVVIGVGIVPQVLGRGGGDGGVLAGAEVIDAGYRWQVL